MTRLASMESLRAAFSAGSGWSVEASASGLPSGPDAGTEYPYCVCAFGGADLEAATVASMLEAKAGLVADCAGKILVVRACLMGGGWTVSQGCEVRWRHSGSEHWRTLLIAAGWDSGPSHPRIAGERAADARGISKIVAQDGGWTDIEIQVPDGCEGLCLSPCGCRADAPDAHRIAVWGWEIREPGAEG